MLARSLVVVALSLGGCRAAPSAVADRELGAASPAWLAGVWRGEQDGTVCEEYWTPLRGGSMLGAGRVLVAGKTVFFEHLRIEGPELGAEHWRYVALPAGRGSTAFELVELEPGLLVFENPTHDFPQRVSYRLREDGSLHARVEGIQAGVSRGEDFYFRRAE
ncbi:MAG: hypothetical protein HZA52_18720 [Planctomycetes bacterium]|nr:hypothetical protein [Planctomycetota bacterium]